MLLTYKTLSNTHITNTAYVSDTVFTVEFQKIRFLKEVLNLVMHETFVQAVIPATNAAIMGANTNNKKTEPMLWIKYTSS